MATLSFTQFLLVPRYCLNLPNKSSLKLVQFQGLRLQSKSRSLAVSKKINPDISDVDASIGEEVEKKNALKTSKRTRKKTVSDSDASSDEDVSSATGEVAKKSGGRTRRKAAPAPISAEGEQTEKKMRKKRTKKKVDDVEQQVSEGELSESEEFTFILSGKDESEEELELEIDAGEDISYPWPPLVCCFGAAQHFFLPSGRPANRLIKHDIHQINRDAYWSPGKFVRAPGGSAGSVALALASLGGKVDVMGKLGDDDFGQAMLHYLNANNVQTRAVKIDSRRATAVSQMRIGKRSRLRLTCVKPCAEDSLLKSEINIDVLKEAKMFYFDTHSLLDQNMRSTTLQAIRISKKLGGVVFYDVNLPLPLWQSSEETKMFIQQVWNLSDIIEVTKQELEFLCGIQPSEEFDTQNNDRTKFVHYKPEVFAPLWHEGLKVLFVTNGTSKIHYYTKEHNGAISGMEDPPITPFTADMSASGDGIVAGILKMLTLEPDLITDKGYLQHTIKYAINCGVIDQWKLARTLGFPPKDYMDDVVPDENGIRSVTEKEYRTCRELVESLSGSDDEYE